MMTSFPKQAPQSGTNVICDKLHMLLVGRTSSNLGPNEWVNPRELWACDCGDHTWDSRIRWAILCTVTPRRPENEKIEEKLHS